MFKSKTDYDELCKLFNYKFQDKVLLQRAITRKSGLLEEKQEESIGHNEVLEYQGDGILRAVVNSLLLSVCPNYNEAQLSEERDNLVSQKGALYKAAEQLRLDRFIIMGKGEETNCQGSGRQKILVDTMEAIIGCIFTDCGENFQYIKSIVCQLPGFERIQDLKDINLLTAVGKGDLEKVKYWLSQGANPTTVHKITTGYSLSCPLNISPPCEITRYDVGHTRYDWNAINLAIRNINRVHRQTAEIVKFLLEHTLDSVSAINISTFSYPLLHETIIYDYRSQDVEARQFVTDINTQLCRLLCHYGAGVNVSANASFAWTGREKSTPLELALLFGDVDKVSILLEYGANANNRNDKHQTPAHLAVICYEYWKQRAKKLMEKPEEENAIISFYHQKDKENCTQKMKSLFTIIEKLIHYGADCKIEDIQGKRAIDLTTDEALKTCLLSHQVRSQVKRSRAITFREEDEVKADTLRQRTSAELKSGSASNHNQFFPLPVTVDKGTITQSSNNNSHNL